MRLITSRKHRCVRHVILVRETRNPYNILTGNSHERIACGLENEIKSMLEKQNKTVTND
jgi:hypothetical protein